MSGTIVFIGDGSLLKINAIGDTLISDGKNELLLHDVLHVPQLTRNLLSVSQLTSQYPLNCEFTDKLLCIKERATCRTMLTGQRKGDLYVLSKSKEVYFSNRQNTASEELWHQRLGHPQKSAVQFLRTQNLILVSSNKKIDSICESCQLGKLSKSPFTSSSSLHCDTWGPTPVLSLGKFRYYACFIDDYSHYIWLHPLRSKSDFVDVYLAFESYVQRQFDKKIKVFHSDGGGEFVNNRLSSHFRKEGIIHQLSCPHTPEQTGIVEHRHRIIRELGMTMIFHSGVPHSLWVEAFTTATFLINRLPSSFLNFTSAYFLLYGNHPNYSYVCLAHDVTHIHGTPKGINLILNPFHVFL